MHLNLAAGPICSSCRRQARKQALADRDAQQRRDTEAAAARRDALAAEAAAEAAFRGDLRTQMAEKRAAKACCLASSVGSLHTSSLHNACWI